MFATAPIKAGALVVEYVGELINEDEYDKRLAEYKVCGRSGWGTQHVMDTSCEGSWCCCCARMCVQGWKHFYIFAMGTSRANKNRKEFIDATRKGSLARYLNHSCEPNCISDVR